MLIVLTGKTASGKDTIKDALLSKFSNLKKVITSTSRLPRKGEKDGTDYHFLSKEEFQKGVSEGKFIEFVEYGGNFYGTQKKDLENYLHQDLLWKIDPSRAGQIKETVKEKTIVIYINTDEQTILERLTKRGLSEEEISSRMADDEAIWQQFHDKYDYVLENVPGKLKGTIDKIVKIIRYNCS